MNKIEEKEQELRNLVFQDAEERYNKYIGKSYYCKLGLGTIFEIRAIRQAEDSRNKNVYLDVFRIDCEGTYPTSLQIDYHNSFDIRDSELHYHSFICIEISELQKSKMIHHFDKIHRKNKEQIAFRDLCINNIKSIVYDK